MNYIRIIPSLLLSKNKLVKGTRFKNHQTAGNPVSTIKAFESQKADEITLIDIDNYNQNKRNFIPDLSTLKEISKETSTPLTFGGGIQNLNIAKQIIENGAEKIFLNRSVLFNKINIKEFVETFGGQAIVIGLNVIKINGKLKIYEKNDEDLYKYIEKMQKLGVGEFKITFVENEGTKKGMDIKTCVELQKLISISSIFEGGVGNLDHIKDLVLNKISSIAIGRILIFNDYNIIKIKTFLKNENFEVRI